MSLAEIKHAVRELSPQEFAELRKFIADQDHAAWTEQMDDAAAGKLDFLFDEADREGAKRQLHDWPEKQ
jgi:anti-sigma factor RsiW